MWHVHVERYMHWNASMIYRHSKNIDHLVTLKYIYKSINYYSLQFQLQFCDQTISPLPFWPMTPGSLLTLATFRWLAPMWGLSGTGATGGGGGACGWGQVHCGAESGWWGVALVEGMSFISVQGRWPLCIGSPGGMCLLLWASSSTTVKSAPVMTFVWPCGKSQVQMASTGGVQPASLSSECTESLVPLRWLGCWNRLVCGQNGEFPVHSVTVLPLGDRQIARGESYDLRHVQTSLLSWQPEWRWCDFGELLDLWDFGECLLPWWFLCDDTLSWWPSWKLLCRLPWLLRWLLWLPSRWWLLVFESNLKLGECNGQWN